MVFNSYIFVLVLLPVCLIGYFGLNYFQKNTLSKIFLIGISLWFYAFFHISYIFLILFSIAINYISYLLSVSLINKAKNKTRKLICGITVFINLFILFVFKYYDFFVSNINTVFKSDLPMLNILLPLGISFFTFQQIAFTVDALNNKAFYPGTTTPYKLYDYSLFVCFFPQLVAGPIVSHKELIPQFADKSLHSFNYESFYKGFFAFVLGLSKKVLIADVLALAVNYGFSIFSELNTPSALLIAVAFTLQLYFDFSGYSDMARGLALMLNIKLPLNFDSPFKTADIASFWNKWHITLSDFFTKYVYIPLGGSRKGAVRTYINIFIIFFLSGLWHGANWTFIIWGIINGIGVIFIKLIKKISNIDEIKNKILKAVLTIINFLYVTLAFVFFRADSVSVAGTIIKSIFSFNFKYGVYPNILSKFNTNEMTLLLKITFLNNLRISYILPAVIMILVCLFIVFFTKNVNELITNIKPGFFKTLFVTVLFLWCTISFSGISTFIYYNF